MKQAIHIASGLCINPTCRKNRPLQVQEQLPATLDLRWTDPDGVLGRDRSGSCALRIYNSGTPGYRYNAMSNNCVMLHRMRLETP